ncbi:iron ABC transporter, partial [Rhizobium johnstonii]
GKERRQVEIVHDGDDTAAGSIGEVLTNETMLSVFGCALRINQVPSDGTPFVLAQSAISRP